MKAGTQTMPPRNRPSDNISLDARAVRHRVSYSLPQLGRLEMAGEFPKRIRLGPNRVAWSLGEILDWMQSKVDARPIDPMSPKVVIDTGDRFVHTKELRSIVLYHPNHIRRLEFKGKFPRRVRISDNRVVWLEREVIKWLDEQRKRGDANDNLRTYHVRLCRPRFEVADVMVKADGPDSAERAALNMAKTPKSGWRLLPYQPETYCPHVQMSVFEETPTYSAEDVQNILVKYEAKYVRYLTLQADTNTGEGTVLFQPWFTDGKLGRLARDLADNWLSAIDPDAKPVIRRGRRCKQTKEVSSR